MRSMTKWAALLLGTLSLGSLASGQSVRIVDHSAALDEKAGQHLLYTDDSAKVIADAGVKKSFYNDLYVVLTPHAKKLPAEIAKAGEVIDFQPNKVALVRLDPTKVEALAGHLHHEGLACGVLTKLSGRPIFDREATTPSPILPLESVDNRVTALAKQASANNIKEIVTELSGIKTRHHNSETGKGVPELLVQKYTSIANGRSDITVETYSHEGTSQDSVIVRIEGADETLKKEVIILGSHIDSIAWFGASAPGADDNASGTATNLEIFRVLVENNVKLDRTLEIHGYAAEEIGLVGSSEIANDYRDREINVVAMVQHDMNLWKAENAPDKIFFVTSNTESGFNAQLATLAKSYSGLPTESAALRGGSSDHASWTRAGFAAAFPFENPTAYNRKIHTTGDTIENSGAFDQAAGFVKLGLGYVSHFGGLR